MYQYDASIFDTRNNTRKKVGTIPFKMYMGIQSFMNRKGQVVALVDDCTNNGLKAVSFTTDIMAVREIKDFGPSF